MRPIFSPPSASRWPLLGPPPRRTQGAYKRFKDKFKEYPTVVCKKIRDGDKRVVRIHEGDPTGRHIVIVDDLVHWATDYKVDGFRFDLMGHIMLRTMVRARDAVNSLTVQTHGVDGSLSESE